jgi:hypothetical protein
MLFDKVALLPQQPAPGRGRASMQFIESRPGVIRSINQRWLLNHWSRIRADKVLPAWQGLEADELVRMTENLTFSDVVQTTTGVRFLIRYHGERIAAAFGSNCRGRYLDEILPPAIREPALETYRHLLADRRPVYNVVDVNDRDGRPVHYERLLLPFGRDHETVDRVLASLETVSPDGAFEHRNLMNLPTLKADFAVCAVIDQA